MAYLQQPSTQSMNFDENQNSPKTKQPPLTHALPSEKGPIGIRGGGPCFDCLAAICCCCALEDICSDCCKNI